ncbi:hypothetical protein LCGC14_2159280 [marine sediment metagenome]|uniref:Ferritin/DPS protein domain-containing protein n=1 Tax=marine sediment metagenome TaxID=412755 RepID=A0A0F9EFH8_9ZZZZ
MKATWKIEKMIKALEAERDKLNPAIFTMKILDYNHQISMLEWVLEDD